ncbi:tRNA threonylcarbamoyladenosine dehydratase [Chitinimonas sp. BJYL2]|uniref:tRNA threonylcarbamoyladenosine dehydratase n=1 Tax=Chitinimonas sp. BJYL2 TaxID=2976696 RepID=UPI0022B3E964|nr:tRNA threonylcarbamoyladenosine dehydratase [Chitinimonas sp. BJYL2]
MTASDDLDYARRFGGVARLYGDAALARFQAARVCVIGIGGVGSWAVEALARSAIGQLTLIDMDHIAPSNVNRQLHARTDTLGQAKTGAMRDRILAINPRAQVAEIDDFLTEENLPTLIAPGRFDYVVDCMDQMRVKVALVAHCRRHKVPLIVSGGAGGRTDATRVALADLALTSGDALLARVRAELRKKHGYAREGKKFGIEAIYSTEPIVRPPQSCEADAPGGGLNCAGYGSAVAVTASFGMAMAGRVLNQLAKQLV